MLLCSSDLLARWKLEAILRFDRNKISSSQVHDRSACRYSAAHLMSAKTVKVDVRDFWVETTQHFAIKFEIYKVV